MNRLPILKDELAFLEEHLPVLEKTPGVTQLAAEFKKRIEQIRQEILTIEKSI